MRARKNLGMVIAGGFELSKLPPKISIVRCRIHNEIHHFYRQTSSVIQMQYKTSTDIVKQGDWSNFVLIEQATVTVKTVSPVIQKHT